MKKVKNNTGTNKTWCGQTILPTEYYTLEAFEYLKWANNDAFLVSLANAEAIVNDGVADITSVSAAIIFLNDDIPKDSDGSPLSRVKSASIGWTFQYNSIHYHTSKVSSLVYKDIDNADINHCSMKFYKLVDAAEVEITGGDLNQTYLDTNCVRTDLYWEPTSDIELIGAKIRACDLVDGTNNLYLWIRGVPDVAAPTGSKDLIVNLNFRCVGAREPVVLDGRSVKRMNYNATYHTNKFKVTLRHPSGYIIGIQLEVEMYKL